MTPLPHHGGRVSRSKRLNNLPQGQIEVEMGSGTLWLTRPGMHEHSCMDQIN